MSASRNTYGRTPAGGWGRRRPCAHCGTSFFAAERGQHGVYYDGLYCSSACRSAAWRARHREGPATKTCAGCGQPFEPARSDARYCSGRCRQAAYRRRHQRGEEAHD